MKTQELKPERMYEVAKVPKGLPLILKYTLTKASVCYLKPAGEVQFIIPPNQSGLNGDLSIYVSMILLQRVVFKEVHLSMGPPMPGGY